MPNKGDKVRVVVEGEYSHQGNSVTNNKAGWHMVQVATPDKLNRFNYQVAFPPETEFEVTQRYRLPEPAGRAIVRDRVAGNIWRKCAGTINCWVNTGGILGGVHQSWWEIMADRHPGDFEVYRLEGGL